MSIVMIKCHIYAICEQQKRSSLMRWARSLENVSYAICEQQTCRSACASAHSDQHFCCSLLRLYNTYTCYVQSFKTLANFYSWAGRFESYLFSKLLRHVFTWCALGGRVTRYPQNSWPGKMFLARKPGIIFHSSECTKIHSNLDFVALFTVFAIILAYIYIYIQILRPPCCSWINWSVVATLL